MKGLMFIFCLLLSMKALAQKADTSLIITNHQHTGKDPIYIIDGNQEGSMKDIKPEDIFSVTIVKPNDAVKIYGQKADSGAAVIITRPFAKKLYQQKLAAFSKKYAAYMASHADDGKLLYVINNTMLIARTNHTLRELYDLTPDNIKDVSFKKDSRYVSDATVIIITKDYIKTAGE
jgi:hypothetical protein